MCVVLTKFILLYKSQCKILIKLLYKNAENLKPCLSKLCLSTFGPSTRLMFREYKHAYDASGPRADEKA